MELISLFTQSNLGDDAAGITKRTQSRAACYVCAPFRILIFNVGTLTTFPPAKFETV